MADNNSNNSAGRTISPEAQKAEDIRRIQEIVHVRNANGKSPASEEAERGRAENIYDAPQLRHNYLQQYKRLHPEPVEISDPFSAENRVKAYEEGMRRARGEVGLQQPAAAPQKASTAPTPSPATPEEAARDTAKIATILRGQFFERTPQEQRPAAERALDESYRRIHPESKGYFADFAKEIYINPSNRAAFLGTTNEQSQAAVAQQQLRSSGEKFKTLASRSTPNSPEAKIWELMGEILSGTAYGMRPAPDTGGHAPYRPPEPRQNMQVSGADVEARCQAQQQALVNFINAHETARDGQLLIKMDEMTQYRALNTASDRCDALKLDFKHFGLQPQPKGPAR